MEYFTVFLNLLAGLGVFLVGVKLLSEGTENLLNNSIRKLFNNTASSKLAGVGIGTAVTALVHSSGVTTVMVVGLVNAGAMSLYQATTVIMGANIGTTITAQIAALGSFDIGIYFCAISGVGAFIYLLAKRSRTKSWGALISGIGLIFVGIELMKIAFQPLSTEGHPAINFFASINNPFILLLIGIVLTAIMQSSAATTSIIIAMAATGLAFGGTGTNGTLFVILGTNIGSCATAILSSMGANTNAKRASLIHLMFNVFGSVLFFIVFYIWKGFSVTVLGVFDSLPTQIAMFHTMFNLLCTAIFLPFSKVFVKISQIIIKEKAGEENITYLDRRFFTNIPVAIDNASKETMYMLGKSIKLLDITMKGFIEKDETYLDETKERLDKINVISKNITDYLIHTSAHVATPSEGRMIATIHQNNGYIVRISELSDNINRYTERQIKENLIFSDLVKSQLTAITKKIDELAEITKEIVLEKNNDLLATADTLENDIDAIRKELLSGHMERLNSGECRSENSAVFISLVANLERVGDYLFSVCQSVKTL